MANTSTRGNVPAHLVPALVTLREEFDRAYPGRSRKHDGWIGDTAHTARKSDHNPDGQGRVKALDLTADGARGAKLAETALAALKRRGQRGYVIHAGRIANPIVQGGNWRAYRGANPHTHHVHVSVHTMLTSTAPWGVAKLLPPRVSGVLDYNTVALLQTLVGVPVDGDMGPVTIKGVQRLLLKDGHKLPKYGADGDFGGESARALEAYLGLRPEKIAGWYPGLIRGLQRLLADLVNTGEL